MKKIPYNKTLYGQNAVTTELSNTPPLLKFCRFHYIILYEMILGLLKIPLNTSAPRESDSQYGTIFQCVAFFVLFISVIDDDFIKISHD